ncbi:PilN domain-containing protein [Taklimakanibacter lacteus]|uniref:PilN domain-containing protein n=1 Tax=Taklimakanibacter lacteus TaxID=2268456 RepID=UPI000E666ACA
MLQSWRAGLADFWIWWTRELKGLFARRSVAQVPGFKAYREILLSGDQVEVTDIDRHKEGERRTLLGAFLPQPGDAAPVALSSAANRPFIFAVPVEKCFLHRVEVPKAGLSRIDQLLGLELSRVTPFAAADILTGWFETKETASETHTTVVQVVVKRSSVNPLLEAFTRWKIPVSGIYAKSAEGHYLPTSLANPTILIGDPGINRWRKFAAGASILALLAVMAATASLFNQQAGELKDLAQRIEAAQEKAVEVRKHLGVMESSSQRILDLKTAKFDGPSPLAIWEELTRIIPDTAWVSGLSIEKRQVTIEGNARSPEELIPLLDGSPLFEAVSFTAPVTKLPGNDLTRFIIRLTLSSAQQLSSAAP